MLRFAPRNGFWITERFEISLHYQIMTAFSSNFARNKGISFKVETLVLQNDAWRTLGRKATFLNLGWINPQGINGVLPGG